MGYGKDGRPRILFADDDQMLHKYVQALLETNGYEIECVKNGSRAIAAFRKRGHDAIIVDLMMPEMNGYELMRELKAIEPQALKRTIVLTGASKDTWEWFDQESVAAFLTKPADIDDLLSEVEKSIARKR